MAKRMLIDAAHPEETRVAIITSHRLEEFDFESSTKKHVKGNIYLAKVTRVEPSLQAAFVDYGGNRHGFLAFSEIHPDYYRIPVSDRDAGETQAEPAEPREAVPEGGEESGVPLEAALPEPVPVPEQAAAEDEETAETEAAAAAGVPPQEDEAELPSEPISSAWDGMDNDSAWDAVAEWERPEEADASAAAAETEELFAEDSPPPAEAAAGQPRRISDPAEMPLAAEPDASLILAESMPAVPSPRDLGSRGDPEEEQADGEVEAAEAEAVETIGGDELDEAETQRSRPLRAYKIQEVIKRRQIMLVQVTKEERGNKGAALSTYLSLAGRYCVLMPNTGRGGGVSRKITNMVDRRRLKDILEDLDIPEGMGVIVRTAGAERSKAEIKRDYEYLLRLWNEIRDLTLHSTAPALIYEEGNLIKRSIRDLYTRDIDEVLVEGEEGYRTAKAFMKMLMPSHARRVQPYRDPQIGLFHRFQVESQIDAIHSPIVQLRSGGYLVLNQTEALVAIDVNSGRATRERNIEETALRTNLEAAEEIARQLRLRDLAGLIVIDFIDMEEHRNQSAVERRLKEALKSDRARIQVGRISPFGLLEMSRQRLRPSLAEASTQPCPHCGGTGFIRSTESTSLYVLRSIEEEGIRRRSAEICVYVPTTVALYILNQKRDSLVQLEARYGLRVLMARDDALIPPAFRLERLRPYGAGETTAAVPMPLTQTMLEEEEEDEDSTEAVASEAETSPVAEEEEEERGRSRRRRRRRRRSEPEPARRVYRHMAAEEHVEEEAREAADGEGEEESEAEARRRRRGRRGGRRRPRREMPGFESPRPAADTIEALPSADNAEELQVQPEATESWGAEASATPVEAASLSALAGDRETTPEVAVAPTPSEATAENLPPPLAEIPAPPVAEAPTPRDSELVEGSRGDPAEEGVPLPEQNGQAAPEQPTPSEEPAPPPLPVQTITERPANPRRGWWQRATHS
jgi:ribonuclease E